jgi:hypothetical protein
MREFGPTYQEGHLSVENEDLIKRLDLQDCSVGLQVSHDGRIWICVNGVAYLRFKPHRRGPSANPDPAMERIA